MNLNQAVMSLKKKEFKEFLKDVEEYSGTNPEDLDTLRWIIEDKYDEKFKVNLEYFKDNQEMLVSSNLELYEELNNILKRLTKIEHYEKCVIVKDCMDNFLKAFRCK